jgi:hypothetical protein
MREEHVWFSIVVAVFLVLVFVVTGCMNLDNKKAELVKSGVHPIDVLCLYDSRANEAICAVRANKITSNLQPQ